MCRGASLVEEEATSTREAPRHIQRRHPSQQMLGDLNERVNRSKVTSIAGFAHLVFVASFEPKDIGHALSDSNWVNVMHEELENFERNQVWVLVEPPLLVIPSERSEFSKTSRVRMVWLFEIRLVLLPRGFAKMRVLILRKLLPLLLVWKLFESFLHLLLPRVLKFSKWTLNLPS